MSYLGILTDEQTSIIFEVLSRDPLKINVGGSKQKNVLYSITCVGGPVSRTDIIPKLRHVYLVRVNTYKVLISVEQGC